MLRGDNTPLSQLRSTNVVLIVFEGRTNNFEKIKYYEKKRKEILL